MTKSEINPIHVNQCLVVIRELYAKYTPHEITEAMKINRAEITAREERSRLTQEIDRLTQQLDAIPDQSN